MTSGAHFLARRERFRSVGSTNDIVRAWLTEGTPEVCLAVAAEQTAGRGRSGRAWASPAGSGLWLSLGFRPAYLEPDRLWRLGAIVGLAMADAAEEVAGLPMSTIRLKWPNDLVVVRGGLRKLAGILGETEDAGTPDVRAIVGIGIDTDWPRDAFPAELAESMTSLRELSGGRPIDNDLLLGVFLEHLEPRYEALRSGYFDVEGWHGRQATTGQLVELALPDGTIETVRAVGVDGAGGGLLVEDATGERTILAADVVHVRPAGVTN